MVEEYKGDSQIFHTETGVVPKQQPEPEILPHKSEPAPDRQNIYEDPKDEWLDFQ